MIFFYLEIIKSHCYQNNSLSNTDVYYSFSTINTYYIMNCIHSRSVAYLGKGGIISINLNGNIILILKNCIFFQSINNDHGGAIWYNCPTGNIFFDKICGNTCYSLSTNWPHGQFSYQITSKSLLNFVSVTHCSNMTIGYRYDPLRIEGGYNNISNTNITKNKVNRISGIEPAFIKEFNLNFSILSLNIAVEGRCLALWEGIGLIYKTNFLLNFGDNIISVYSSGNYIFNECIFTNHTGLLFNLNSGSLIVKNSVIDSSNIGNANHLNQNNSYIFVDTMNFDYYQCYIYQISVLKFKLKTINRFLSLIVLYN